MSHQVIWTKKVLDFFCDAANLTPLERDIMVTRLTMTGIEQSQYLSISTSSLDRAIKRLKVKYDACQKEYPDVLKPRRNSASETYQDEH